ncbi:MAG TPA: hypothetical protein VK773_08500 [Acidimicrobiales bacterium]|jgi:hypothetical protein|nr:hypothetical protein [Acidimicrobiales bacterium]
MRLLRLVPILVLASAGVLVSAGSAGADNAVTHETGTLTAPCWDHVHPSVNVTGSYNFVVGVDQGGSGNWVFGTWTFTAANGRHMGFFVVYQITDQGHEQIGRSVFANNVLGSNWDLVDGTAYFSSGGYFTGSSTGNLVDLCPVLGYYG